MTRSFIHDGRRISYVNIYAIPRGAGPEPFLEFITARESGFEGIACIDDTARAAILALQVYERQGSPAARRLAHDWLSFVAYMQQPDGRFVNFILDEHGAKNLPGRTSYVGGRWWTARAMWALATAWRITGDSDYLHAFQRGQLAPTRDLKIKAVYALALMEIYQRQPDDGLGRRICALCDAIVASATDPGGQGYFRDGNDREATAMWGYHQLQAVARAARLFSRIDYTAACEQTVRTLVEPVVAGGFYHVYPTQQEHQCAYDVSTLVLGLEELYRATRKPAYRELALRCASWLDGNNAAGETIYNLRMGRCLDGITNRIASLNCGAESAIEAGFIALARQGLRERRGRQSQRLAMAATASMAVSALLL